MVRGQAIEEDPPYRNPKSMVNPQVTYSQSFAEWQAAIACGATLTELMEWDEGEKFSVWFKARVVAFHNLQTRIRTYVEDARIVKPKKS